MILKQTKEEIANSLTHLLGVGISISTAIILYIKVKDEPWDNILSVFLFSLGMISLYLASTIYHWTLPGKCKQIFRYCDHINIYVLIAASYSPILICSIGGKLGWTAFIILWIMTLIGSFYKIFFLGKYPKLSLIIYLSMGWSIILLAKYLLESLPTITIIFVVFEALFYTIGTYFYSNDAKHKYYHAIWHLFVLGGTISHIFAVWFIL